MRTPEMHFEQIASLFPHTDSFGTEPDLVERIPLEKAVGRICVEDIEAQHPSPLFDNSQMDGYAVSKEQLASLPAKFPVGATIAAGADPDEVLPEGITDHVIPVMTGAGLPKGTAAIIPVEDCTPPTFEEAEAEGVTLPTTTEGKFLRLAGSDMAVGELLVERGSILTPLSLTAMVSQRYESVLVNRKMRIITCTGGAEVGGSGPASVPDVNGPLMRDLCERYSIELVASILTNDNVEQLRADLSQAVAEHQPDAIVTSGGISHGKFEVFRQLLADDPEAWFGHVAQQPGGPQGIAHFEGVPVICLPGNPLSTLVSFRLFVGPVLGVTGCISKITASIIHDIDGLPDHRDQFRRGIRWIDGSAQLRTSVLGGGPSHLLAQSAHADCLVRIPAQAKLKAGDLVTIYPL